MTDPAPPGSLLDRLNRLSLTRTFTPQIDVDWSQTTTDEEYEALYAAWSLLAGTGADAAFDMADRVQFAKYQQMNLMAFTALLERHAIGALARLYDLDPSDEFSEYIGHFIKEEIYHTMMFQRAIRAIQATMPDARPLPQRALDRTIRGIFGLTATVPGTKLRSTFVFLLLRFAEQVSIYAHQMAQARIPRRESLAPQIWAFHALDESRHLAFDSMMLDRCRLPRPFGTIPLLMAAPCCVLLSILLNANEVWAARELGAPVSLRDLPRLMRSTQAPFKRRVFSLLTRTILKPGEAPETE